MKNFIKYLTTTLVAFGISMSANAGVIEWNITGLGVTSTTELSVGEYQLNYDLRPSGYSVNTWSVSAMADQAGDYTFDYSYNPFHSWFQPTAFLTTTQGDTLYSGYPTPISGTYTFSGVSAGDVIGFNMGGNHFDSSQILAGQLNLTQVSAVPEPSMIALMLGSLGLVGFMANRRKKA